MLEWERRFCESLRMPGYSLVRHSKEARTVHRAPFILIVEDNQALRAVVARNLEARGYLVLQAGTFREAVEQLAVKPALMILDITLPDATGWDVAAWLESMADPVPI